MRLLALLSITIISLSGCAMQVSYDEAGTVTDNSTSTCTRTVNGQTRPCDEWATPSGPKENVSIDQRAPLTDGLDTSWTFSVHPGANITAVWFAVRGYDGQDVGLQPQRGCIKLTGPYSKTTGNCGIGGVAVSVSGSAVNTEPEVLLDVASLPVGDYTLSATMPRGAADYHVVIDVHY